ncbi:catalase HPII [Bacillus canaveralius]|uniref:Catalase n=1 Tax=Bacillus canaveralius TaxID=1403243 RepID=A0A2N5GH67_9BACI|nr:catalase [Bacillus canaveralius]PLR80112.1 catalase HPII [Bacillus canaveralius]PLR91636.1 catalase HPII [Bacillus canaveralius]RSK57596.1 catalase [Bacillus canaveralius]
MKDGRKNNENRKNEQLEQFRVDDAGQKMTTNQGLKISEDEFSLKAGERGPTLMEDFHFREKMTHFDHERIPERIVHARGFAAHGEFEVYESMKEYTKAKFLQDPAVKTPVFVRFSTVAGSRGSAETVRDVRGFATKFYTEEGNYDLVGNNIPVFFIQDAIKFPDLIHAVKPEPHNEMPQAASAHDTFWDFVANNQESAHMIMWHMSDRAIPRSLRMMEGFGVHTFRFVNDQGKAHFVKFHWKPVLGVHSLVWDEAQKISGKDPDYQRRDLWESIEKGDYPVFELGVQLLAEEDEFKFDFDILDPTKLWPEEDVPVKIIGKMTLNRNVDNVFAETEQVAFHPGHVVPGIDFSNDPLLQGRLFSYTDTQLIRLGGPNFHELPINRPVCPFHNNQRDGYGRQTINVGQVSYHNNSLAANTPAPASEAEGGYVHYQEKVEGRKIRSRSDSFKDHFSQATLFWNSMSQPEKQHIIEAFSFELGKVKSMSVRQQVADMFANVNLELATAFAEAIGVNPPQGGGSNVTKSSAALSQENTKKKPNTRKVAVIVGNDFNGTDLVSVLGSLKSEGIQPEIISEKLGTVKGSDGSGLEVAHTFLTADSVLFDAVYVVGGSGQSRKFQNDAAYFVNEAFSHFKAIGATHEGVKWLEIFNKKNCPGVVTGEDINGFVTEFVAAVAAHRHWDRQIV